MSGWDLHLRGDEDDDADGQDDYVKSARNTYQSWEMRSPGIHLCRSTLEVGWLD